MKKILSNYQNLKNLFKIAFLKIPKRLLSVALTSTLCFVLFTMSNQSSAQSVDAGLDQIVAEGQPVSLLATPSDLGSSVSYIWGPKGGTLTNPSFGLSTASNTNPAMFTAPTKLTADAKQIYRVLAFNPPLGSAEDDVTITVLASPEIMISHSELTMTIGSAITPVTVTLTRTLVATYSINPSINNGLSFNINTGTISGALIAVADPVIYTITATNLSGTATAMVTITAITPTLSSTVPASLNVGDVLSVELTYTSIVDAILSIELAKYTISGDFVDNSRVVYKEEDVAAGTGIMTSLTIAIPTITNPTSSLTGESYKVKVSLINRRRVSLVTHLKDIELILPAPVITSTVPASVEVGDVLSVELTYTSTVGAIVSIELAKYNSGGDYVDDSQVAYKEKDVAAGTGTTMTITIAIPTSTNPTSSLTGESYKVKVLVHQGGSLSDSFDTHLKDIELILPAPVISIKTSSLIAKAGSVISDIFVDSSTGGSITGYSIAPPIGNGLSFDDTTGIIYGTPTAVAQEIIYTITATNAAGETATATVSITVVSSLGNKDFEKIGFSVSPNPTGGILNITVDEKAEYRLLNIRGQVLKKGVSTKGESKINIYSLARGVYFLNIKTGKGSFTEKIVKN